MNKKLKAALFMSPLLVGVVAFCIAEPEFLFFLTVIPIMVVIALFTYGLELWNKQ